MMKVNHLSATVAHRAGCSFRSCRIAHAPRRVLICQSGAPPASTEKASLLQRMGGQQALEVAVDKFYNKVVADDRIKHFFEGVDMKKQRGHQVAFLSFALGGQKYTGRSMEAAHRGLAGLNDTHFDAVVENLAATLQEMGVSDDLIAEAGAVVETTRDAVLNRHANN